MCGCFLIFPLVNAEDALVIFLQRGGGDDSAPYNRFAEVGGFRKYQSGSEQGVGTLTPNEL
jgi:hypothetical protein